MGLDFGYGRWFGSVHAVVVMERELMPKRIIAWLDMNSDGELSIDDLHLLATGHHWMFIGGLFIFIGSIGNVLGYWSINSDAYWAAAGLAAMLEYRDDVKRGRRR